jgi:hypothetical protein
MRILALVFISISFSQFPNTYLWYGRKWWNIVREIDNAPNIFANGQERNKFSFVSSESQKQFCLHLLHFLIVTRKVIFCEQYLSIKEPHE